MEKPNTKERNMNQHRELIPCSAFRLIAEPGHDWERDERERREHDRIIERIEAAQSKLPFMGQDRDVIKTNNQKGTPQ